MSYYWGMFRSSFAPFDPVALTVEMEEEVLAPIDTFRALFMRNAYLTRLATFISPEEMTKDPVFVTNRLLPDVAPNRTAIGHILCGDEEYDSSRMAAGSAGFRAHVGAAAPTAETSTRCRRGRSPGSANPTVKVRW
jgi:hypothetical protein